MGGVAHRARGWADERASAATHELLDDSSSLRPRGAQPAGHPLQGRLGYLSHRPGQPARTPRANPVPAQSAAAAAAAAPAVRIAGGGAGVHVCEPHVRRRRAVHGPQLRAVPHPAQHHVRDGLRHGRGGALQQGPALPQFLAHEQRARQRAPPRAALRRRVSGGAARRGADSASLGGCTTHAPVCRSRAECRRIAPSRRRDARVA